MGQLSDVVLESRVRHAPVRPAVARSDIKLALALPFYLLLAWFVPERRWARLCRWIVRHQHIQGGMQLTGAVRAGALTSRRAHSVAAELDALRFEHYFQYLREYRPGGWQTPLALEGVEHLEQAMAAGRGAIVWVGHTVFHGLAFKKGLGEAGFKLNHLSRREHGFSKTRFGIAILNPIRNRIEDRYLRRRIIVERGAEERAVRAAVRELAGNGIVSITAGDWEGRQIAHFPLLDGTMSLATGAPALAHATGAILLPAFVIRQNDRIRVVITPPIAMDQRSPRNQQVAAAMMEYAARLQPIIRAYPGQWRGWAYLRPQARRQDHVVNTQQAPSLSVVISTYKRPEGLRRLLTALESQIAGRPERKVVVVNDGSHNSGYEAVVAEFAHMIDYHPLPRNLGIAAARNESVRNADSDYVVFTDDDCLPPPYWLDWLAARLLAYPDLDVVAGAVKPLPPFKPNFFAGVQTRHGIHPWPAKTAGGIRFVTANVAIRRKLFWDLGGFRISTDFPGAGEDTELSVRVSRTDCSRCLDPDWFVEHDIGDGFVTNVRRFRRYGYADMLSMRTTAVLAEYGYLRHRARRRRFKDFVEQYRRHLPVARSASSWWPVQWLSAFLASIVFVAYFDGVAQASKDAKAHSSS
jgi:glycosyltransferase involved in cell wall biosynthesis/lauroyl/myristoyl acyltransferase